MTYRFAYSEESPYGRAVELVRRHRRAEGEVVVDLGCGHGAIATPIMELGLSYVGIDADPSGINDLTSRGFEAVLGDVSRPGALVELIERTVGERPVAAICMLDVIEHLAEPDAVLGALSGLSDRLGGGPLVVSIPNVTHFDLGAKLLLGRWDVTATGLLDATHLHFFSEAHLEATMAQSGWDCIGASDFELVFSDQHFPADMVALERSTSIGLLLATIRHNAGPGTLVNQFVRAYTPNPSSVAASRGHGAAGSGASAPFLTVLVRTQGQRLATLEETLLSLAAQTCSDFDVLVLAHDVADDAAAEISGLIDEFHESFSSRVRLVRVQGGGRSRPLNEGAGLAQGRYLATLDDDDLAFAHWVEAIKQAAGKAPGRVVHVGVADQHIAHDAGAWRGTDGYRVVGRPRCPYPISFELFDHLTDNRTPNCGFAVPRSLVADLGERWDETLPVYEDWEYLLRASSLCGVESARTVGALIRVWVEGDRSTTVHSAAEWDDARIGVVDRLDARPLLLAPGSMSTLRRLVESAEAGGAPTWRAAVTESSRRDSVRALEEARAEIDAIRASRSWRAMAVPRSLGTLARRALGRVRR
jgi:2-polyprenyl-3-methyl-5-hydroxy-6-metoxy-1,4-benzoquinol methylase